MTAIVLGGLCLVSALSWVVTAFFLPDLGTRVLLTLVSLALAGVVYVWARACVVVSQTAGTVVVRNPTRRGCRFRSTKWMASVSSGCTTRCRARGRAPSCCDTPTGSTCRVPG